MDKLELGTTDLTGENIDVIARLFPQAVTEVADESGQLRKAIDFEALRQELADGFADSPAERYQFTWPGKQAAKQEARRPSRKALRSARAESVDFDTTQNLYIEGDNLDALKLLRNTYAGQVTMIYIDPPYNTGNDFVYDDDYSQSAKDYVDKSGDFDPEGGRLVQNLSSNGRFHSDWCSMMYPRLLLAKDLLTSDGAIFVSIDDNESAQLRKICDEVFGESGFVADIAWQRTYSPRNDAKGISSEVEHILVYSRRAGWEPNRLARTAEMDAIYKSPDNNPQLWRTDNSSAPGAATHQGMVYAIQNPFTGEYLYPPISRCWRTEQIMNLSALSEWAPYELRDLNDAEKRARVCGIAASEVRQGVKGIVLSVPLDEARLLAQARYDEGSWPLLCFTSEGTGGIARKRYLDESRGCVTTNLWPYSDIGNTDEAKKELKSLFDCNAPFDTPKPVRLIQRMLNIATDEQSLVMDFFSGSATTTEAVMLANAKDGGNRSYILVQIAEQASDEFASLANIGKERIRRAGVKIKQEAGLLSDSLDIGFRVLKIDSSSFEDRYATPSETTQQSLSLQANSIKLDRSAEDVLLEILPALRIPLSASIEELTIDGKQVFNVNHNQLLACFDTAIDTEVIEQIAKLKPKYAVFSDSAFVDDSTIANFEELFKTYSPDTERRIE